mgnify:FL=1
MIQHTEIAGAITKMWHPDGGGKDKDIELMYCDALLLLGEASDLLKEATDGKLPKVRKT